MCAHGVKCGEEYEESGYLVSSRNFTIKPGWKEGQESLGFGKRIIEVIDHYVYSGKEKNKSQKGTEEQRHSRDTEGPESRGDPV